MNKKIALITAFVIMVCSMFTAGCAGVKTRTFYALDTAITITAYNCTDEIIDSMIGHVNDYDTVFNIYNKDSEIYKLNQYCTLEEASETLCVVLKAALKYAKMTDGAFDPTIGAVSMLWDFDNAVIPQKEAIEAALKTVDYNNVVMAGRRITLKNGAKLDLGAMAKGYITGIIASRMKQDGITHATLDFGGTIYIFGEKNIKVGIQTPFGMPNQVSAQIASKDRATVVTSGNYQRCFDKDGVHYHHILDPKTGYPANNGLDSVTVVGTDPGMDDAFATALFVMGREKASDLVNRVNGMEALFIEHDETIYHTSGLKFDGDFTFTLKQND
ncbi:MAG: FAD:protein FMN transferase [Oscillospiraceae bacterium]|nr:FAD:protein FMN transferase [Candidatus Equicaccousia limihippi]